MAGAERVEVFEVPIEKFYQVIIDYASYPEFVEGVDKIEVLKQTKTGAKVRFHINMIKKFTYEIELKHKENKEVTWSLIEGDLFKHNDGGWKLKDLGDGKVEVKYFVDADFKIFAPKMIVNKLVSSNLPATMKAYYKRALAQ